MPSRCPVASATVLCLAFLCACGSLPPRSVQRRSPLPFAEVGRLEIGGATQCVATLFTPSSAITAAHCLPPGMTEVTPRDAVLALDDEAGARRFAIDRVYAFGESGSGGADAGLNGDVAVLHLTESVPVDLATPRPLARARLVAGDEVTFVGPLERRRPQEPPRRIRTWRFDPAMTERIMLPGDSGAPLILGSPRALGPVAGVASGYVATACGGTAPDRMLFGDVARVVPDLEASPRGQR